MVNTRSSSMMDIFRVRLTENEESESFEVVSPEYKGMGISLSASFASQSSGICDARQHEDNFSSNGSIAARSLPPAAPTECDAQTNPTTLYKLLETSKWENARMRALSHPIE
eukprot:12816173-Ditylum_brightwellii.AAC.1